MYVIWFTLFFSALLWPSSDLTQPAQRVATHIIYRHGDRAPASLYPTSTTDPHTWPNGLGQLTTRGQLQHVRLGQYIRQRYSDLLNTTYVASEVTVRSTDYDRTLMSAYSNLLGLYPTSQDQLDCIISELSEEDKWPQNLPWQPIPVHTVPTSIDYLMSNGDCPRFYEHLAEIQNSSIMKNLTEQYRNFFDQLHIWSGLEIHDIFDAWFVADIVLIEKLYNIHPPWATSAVLAQLQTIVHLSFSQMFSSFDISRLLGGPLIRDVMNNVEHVITNHSDGRKAKIYSGHDINIAAVLAFLGMSPISSAPYASTLFFDLYRQEDQSYAIKVDYLSSTNSHVTQSIPLPDCSNDLCPVQRLEAWLKERLPSENMAEECRTQHQTSIHRWKTMNKRSVEFPGFS